MAQSLPESARTSDDGLYRAIDTYLKTHPSLSEHERRRICKVMNYEKLSQDECSHVAQNDGLRLRTSIQVLLLYMNDFRLFSKLFIPEKCAENSWDIFSHKNLAYSHSQQNPKCIHLNKPLIV
ncbi:phototropic-responsive NPH3 family protein [Striga asiatica]|uniref:Phototropic-responsive NPH3 family protein n=1 Tax=Striga asiatica TaxID=4170 RepID=A0A5A7QX79_STRAF|nr:phototropic-responsive NPH3 family protein [Striga asiatica]